jgi:hypothetical protein
MCALLAKGTAVCFQAGAPGASFVSRSQGSLAVSVFVYAWGCSCIWSYARTGMLCIAKQAASHAGFFWAGQSDAGQQIQSARGKDDTLWLVRYLHACRPASGRLPPPAAGVSAGFSLGVPLTCAFHME